VHIEDLFSPDTAVTSTLLSVKLSFVRRLFSLRHLFCAQGKATSKESQSQIGINGHKGRIFKKFSFAEQKKGKGTDHEMMMMMPLLNNRQ
jgi:hypothetical protein